LTPEPQMTTSHRPVSILTQGRIDRTFPVLGNRMHGRDGRRVSGSFIFRVRKVT